MLASSPVRPRLLPLPLLLLALLAVFPSVPHVVVHALPARRVPLAVTAKDRDAAIREEKKELDDEDAEISDLLNRAHALVSKDKQKQFRSSKFSGSKPITEAELRFAREAGLTEGDLQDLRGESGAESNSKLFRHNPKDRHSHSSIPDRMVAPADQLPHAEQQQNPPSSHRLPSADDVDPRNGSPRSMLSSSHSNRDDPMLSRSSGRINDRDPVKPVEPVSEDQMALANALKSDRVTGDSFEGIHVHVSTAEDALRDRNIPFQSNGSDSVSRRSERAMLREQVDLLRQQLEQTHANSEMLQTALTKARAAFSKSVEEAKQERVDEITELKNTIEEQKRAFDELLEEKRLISKVLSDEQKALNGLQDRIQHPDLGLWLRDRAKRAALLLETPETDAVKYYAKKYMAPRVDKLRHRLEVLEKRVEHTVDHLLPARYGSFVALLLSCSLIAFPVFVTMSTLVALSSRMSLKQYVLLGNVFLAAFMMALCLAGLLLRQDPLQTLYEANANLFIFMQLLAAVGFPLFLVMLVATVSQATDRLDMFVFGCEFVFYVLVGMNYRSKVFRPAMLGQNIETTSMMYFVYLMDFVSMTMLTVSAARKPDRTSAFMWDMEANGPSGRKGGGPEMANGPTMRSTTTSALGRGLLKQMTQDSGDDSAKRE